MAIIHYDVTFVKCPSLNQIKDKLDSRMGLRTHLVKDSIEGSHEAKASRTTKNAPWFRVDASWPKPLPSVDGHQWVTGEVGGSCMTADDHVVTVNRGFQSGGLVGQDGTTSVPTPPVVEYDPEGNVARAWGDPALDPTHNNRVVYLPNGIHGCFVDYLDNVWIAGNGDGVVQKWTRNGLGKK